MAQPRTRPRVMLHFVAPPPGQDGVVLGEIGRVYAMATANPDVDFVLDRGHVSWFVYAHLRGVPGSSLEDFHAWEVAHLPPTDRVRLVLADAPVLDLVARDDGKSTYTRDSRLASIMAAQQELYLFGRYAAESLSFPRPAGTLQELPE